MSSDEEVVCVRKKKFVVNDSSDDENELVDKTETKVENIDYKAPESGSETNNKYKKKQRRIAKFYSSSESDVEDEPSLPKESRNKKYKDIKGNHHSSTSEMKETNLPSKEYTSTEDSSKEHGNSSEEDDKFLTEHDSTGDLEKKSATKSSWYKNSDLFDAESSDEENTRIDERKDDSGNEDIKTDSDNEARSPETPKIPKGKQHKENTARKERKSKTKALEEIQDIHRESQRMMREGPVSIPYHRPKQRSLAEFLVRRKSVPKVPLRTSSDQLQIVLREIEEREKEAVIFYKSESSEDESEVNDAEEKVENSSGDHGKLEQPVTISTSKNCLDILTPEQSFSNCKDINALLSTDNNTQLLELNNTEEFVNKGNNVIGMCIESNVLNIESSESISVNKEVGNNNNVGLTSKETEIDNSIKVSASLENVVVNTNNMEESTIVGNKISNTIFSKEPESELLPNLETNSEKLSLDIGTGQSEAAKQLQNEIKDEVSPEKDIDLLPPNSSNSSANLVNTEEFSLRLSESQSEYESSERLLSQNTSHNTDGLTNNLAHNNNDESTNSLSHSYTDDSTIIPHDKKDVSTINLSKSNTDESSKNASYNIDEPTINISYNNVEESTKNVSHINTDETTKNIFHSNLNECLKETFKSSNVQVVEVSARINKDAQSDVQADKNDPTSQDNNEMVAESEEPKKIDRACKENDLEDELYRKYNVDFKLPLVSSNTGAPKIIGSHDEVIDLDEGVHKLEDNDLMKRFLTHLSYKQKHPKKTLALSIMTTEKDAEGHVTAINEEVLRMLGGEEDEEEDPKLARPGAKMARLRARMQQEMERQRNQEWAKKVQEQRLYEDEEVFEGEKDVCDGNNDENIDTENKEDETEEEEELEDEEEEEEEDDETDDEIVETKRKSKSIFLDDEAEESDDEPYMKTSGKDSNKKDGARYYDYDDDCNENDDDGNDNDDDHHQIHKNNNDRDKSGIIGDSKEENDIDHVEKLNQESRTKLNDKKVPNDISDFFIKRPAVKKPKLPRIRTADIFSSQEVLKYSPDDDELPSFQKPRPMGEKVEVEEKLSEPPSMVSPAFQLTALENTDGIRSNWSEPSTPSKEIFSPKIVTPVRTIPPLVEKSPLVCTQDMENMCSGSFTSQPLQDYEENVQDFELFLAEDSQIMEDNVTPVKTSNVTGKYSDEKEKLRDLLLEDEEDLPAKLPYKKTKKLDFSDDECDGDDNEAAALNSEASDEGEDDNPDEIGREIEPGADDVAYDSEENEVEVAKFLDAEAELSEEEWSSEDEDEQGLDALEMEEADREKIDQRKLKRQLDQIHMKEMMKEDKKQVKLLQELLLDDGELHSDSKRQRLFRWSNNAAFGEGDNKAALDSDEDKAEEDEDEEQWRKSRHERELFLQEHSKKAERLESLEVEDSDSQLLKLGQKALKRLNSNSQEPRLTPPCISNPLASPDAKKPFPLPKRGSFLSRGQQALSRLAQMVSSSSDGPIQQPKNSRNFVFASISPTKGEQEEPKPVLVPNKRKLPHLPLPVPKKPCVKNPKTANKKSLFEALAKVQR